ncbi:MAG: hypothetical protein FWG43_04070, partial [Clostridiales bacterium]|nr:hypothetical protein [Clostridiales bacterium]
DAEHYFQSICRMPGNTNKTTQMRKQALAVRSELTGRLSPRAVIQGYDCEAIQDHGLLIEGHYFPCHGLAGLKKEHILAVYAFVLTIGDLTGDDTSKLNALYCDFWGTAYLYTAAKALRAQLTQNHQHPAYITNAIAPGYDDMGLEKLAELLNLVGSNEIGVHLQGLMMKPLKSLAGFYLVIKDKSQWGFLPNPYVYCHKKKTGCAFCSQKDDCAYCAR